MISLFFDPDSLERRSGGADFPIDSDFAYIGGKKICQPAKKCGTDAGMLCNLLKSQWRMVSVLSFCEVIRFQNQAL
jgi:hypothetical protein